MSECAVEPIINVVLAWDGGSLTIGPDCETPAGLWWNSLELPAWSLRYVYAPPSAWEPGNVLLSAVRDSAAVPVRIAARGADLPGLMAQQLLLETAVGRWPYTVSITVDGTALGEWDADPVAVSWGAVTPQRASLWVAEASLSIPVQPPGAP